MIIKWLRNRLFFRSGGSRYLRLVIPFITQAVTEKKACQTNSLINGIQEVDTLILVLKTVGVKSFISRPNAILKTTTFISNTCQNSINVCYCSSGKSVITPVAPALKR